MENDEAVLSLKTRPRARIRPREALLAAATAEFLSAGYEGASLRHIVRQAGVSSNSLYRHFPTKELLFQAVVAAKMEEGWGRVAPAPGRPMAQVLHDFGLAYLTEFLAPGSIAFYRMMVAESARIPDTTRTLWETGPRQAIASLQVFLDGEVEAGRAEIGDTWLAAAQFIDMTRGGLHLRVLLTGVQLKPAAIRASVSQAVSIFCRGVRPSA